MELLTIESLVALLTLSFLEIVLGIDNIIMIAIFAGKLPKDQQDKARKLGLMGALVTRIALLLTLNWIIHLTQPFMSIFGKDLSWKDVVLALGGLFLIAKSTKEIYVHVEKVEEEDSQGFKAASSFWMVILQIALVDIIFSLDSVITAVGMARQVPIMVVAVMVSVFIMYFFSKFISDIVHSNPSIKVLALSFLVLVGVLLLAEGFGEHMNKGYVYFAMAFSFSLELINKRYFTKRAKVNAQAAKKIKKA